MSRLHRLWGAGVGARALGRVPVRTTNSSPAPAQRRPVLVEPLRCLRPGALGLLFVQPLVRAGAAPQRRLFGNRSAESERSIFDDEDDEDGEFEQAVQLLHEDSPARQLDGAKRLSALLKPHTASEDAPVELPHLDSAEEERRALLRSAWSSAMEDPDAAPGAETSQGRAKGAGELDDDDEAVLLSTLGFGDISFDMAAAALGAVDALGLLPRTGGVASGGVLVDFTARGGQFALAAALLHPFDHVLGVEGNEEKCEQARARLDSLQRSLLQVVGSDDQLAHEVSFEHSGASSDELRLEDSGLLAADVVAVNCLGLNDYHINDLSEALLGLRANAVIINFGRRLPCPGADLLDTRAVATRFDDVNCHILQRVSDTHNAHLPPVELPACTGFPGRRESGDLLRARTAAAPRLARLVGGSAAVPPAQGGDVGAAGAMAGAGAVSQDVRHVAAMTLSYCAHSEATARMLVGEDHLIVESAVGMLGASGGDSGDAPALAAAAATVMLLRALGQHPCALPAIIDTPGCVEQLVALLAFEHPAVAAGAADALLSCLVFVEARAVLAQAGVVPALQGLRKRAAAAQHQQAVETAELVLTLLGESGAICIYVYIYRHMLYIYMYVCMYLSMYLSIYLSIYIYTHTHTYIYR